MADLRKQPLKVLSTIAKNCYLKDFDFEDPYDDVDKNMGILKSSVKWVGSDDSLSFEEMEFIAKFMELNINVLTPWIDKEVKFEDISKNITLPVLKKYNVKYSLGGSAYVTEYWETDWDCYDEDWVESSMRESESDGAFYWGDGGFVSNSVENFEWDQVDIDEVSPVQKEYRENILSKIVLENNRETIEDLDKQTLIKLRDMINQRLSSI